MHMSTPNGTGEDGADVSDTSRFVYDLDPQCTLEDVEPNRRYRATVNGVVEYGVFVEMGTRHMAAQPYLRPAADQHAATLRENIARKVDAAIRSA